MKPIWKKLRTIGVVLMVVGGAACALTPRPVDYHDDRDEKPGPGLFSGEAGGFVITGEQAAKTTGVEKASTVSP